MKYDPDFIDPAVTPYGKCPYCGSLILLEFEENSLPFQERKCPHCEVFLEQEEIIQNFVRQFTLTQACSSANKIFTLDIAVFPFLGVGLLLLYMDFPVWLRALSLLPYLSPVLLCLRWFYRHWYWLRHPEAEYLEALKGVKRSLLLWAAANLLNWILLLA
ncbi:MAG: hypothetical protein M3384_02430 [Acidobacteriota bacterium]|nr:hypothetical protein [Acidobacteriota bacterium]